MTRSRSTPVALGARPRHPIISRYLSRANFHPS